MAKAELYWWGGKTELTHAEVVECTNAGDTMGHLSAIVASALALVATTGPAAPPIAGIVASVFYLGSQVLKNSDKGNGVNIYWIDTYKIPTKAALFSLRMNPLFLFGPGKNALEKTHNIVDSTINLGSLVGGNSCIPCFVKSR